MPEPLRLALIGAGGRIAADWLTVVEQTPTVRLDNLVESDPDRRGQLRGHHVCGDVEELLRGPLPELAIVATPPITHEPIATALLRAGVHVLCEKPLALDVPSARRMLDTARSVGRVLMMASKFRFVDDVIEAQARIAAGLIGEPVFYDNAFCARVDMTGRWNSRPGISGGGVLIDNGAHAVDLARFLFGEVERVLASPGPRLQDVEVEDSVRVMFETGRGALGRSDLSWSVATGDPNYAAVHGPDGSIQLGWRGARIRRGDQWSEFGTGYDKLRAFRSQFDHFVDVARGVVTPRIEDRDALESVRFVAAAQRAIELGRWVALKEVDE